MRVFARVARSIGGLKLVKPVLRTDLARQLEPVALEIAATLLDTGGRPLSGSVPVHLKVIDPLGGIRHEFFRATSQGQFHATVPLAANDPVGEWTISVEDLLALSGDRVTFRYDPPTKARAVTGAVRRAVAFGKDRDHIFRFARQNRDLVLIKGKSDHDAAAARRLTEILKPWNIRCREVDAASVQARELTEEEAKTWAGLHYAGSKQIKAGKGNNPMQVGFGVEGAAVLIGNPADNPLIKFLAEQRFLPYQPVAGAFPGVGRGYLAWQRDGISYGRESVTLIADDEVGMNEAVGSFYEAVAGIEPLTPFALPEAFSLETPRIGPGHDFAADVAWTAVVPDRVTAISVGKDGIRVLSHDGSVSLFSAAGKLTATKPADAALEKEMLSASDPAADKAAKKQTRPDRLVKLAALKTGRLAVAYWGGTLRTTNADGLALSEQQLPQDVTALAWHEHLLIAGLADGRVVALTAK
jgi:hypothetical protein